MKKINFRQTAVLPSACLVLMMGLSAAYPSATEAPFPVVRLAGEFSVESAWKNVSEISVVSEGFQGTTQFQYDDEALYIRTVVRNSAAVFAPAEAVSKEQCRLYEYDSMEFWLGRHQFTIGIAGECAEAFDYTAGRKIDGAEVLFKRTPGGYEIVARLPWAGLPSPHGKRELLILSVWFNRVLQQDGKALRSATPS